MAADEKDGRPQGATTGRWEIVSNIGKEPQERKWKRWSDVPMWYRVLDRFGLPTLIVLILLYGGYRVALYGVSVMDRQATAFTAAMQRQVEATEKLADKVERLSSDTAEALSVLLDRDENLRRGEQTRRKQAAPERVR